MKTLVRLLATFGPVGYAPIAPATAASAVVTLVGYFLPAPPLPVALGLIAVGAWLAIGLCGAAERQLGHDAKPIVADEAVGQSVALVLVPRDPIAFLASFLLFRLFGIPGRLGVYAGLVDRVRDLAWIALGLVLVWFTRPTAEAAPTGAGEQEA